MERFRIRRCFTEVYRKSGCVVLDFRDTGRLVWIDTGASEVEQLETMRSADPSGRYQERNAYAEVEL